MPTLGTKAVSDSSQSALLPRHATNCGDVTDVNLGRRKRQANQLLGPLCGRELDA